MTLTATALAAVIATLARPTGIQRPWALRTYVPYRINLSTVALGTFLRGAREMKDQGTFNYTKDSADFGEVSELLAPR